MAVTLKVPSHQEDNLNFPNFRKPAVVGCYSLNEKREFCHDLSELKYIIPHYRRKEKQNLNYEITTLIKKDDTDEKLDTLLRWILLNTQKLQDKHGRLCSEFVCFRGLLTMLICTPYEKRDDWIICATKWKGTVYLCAHETENAKKQRLQASEHQKTCMAWGRKFEQYLTTEKPRGIPNVEKPVNENSEFCVTFQSKLNNHILLYGAEMDCVNSDVQIVDMKELQNTEFIEIKTSRVVQHKGQHMSMIRYKFMKWWAQSFLVNINKVVCGFRDDYGVVQKVEEFRVGDLARMSKGVWDAALGMRFCDDFLNFVKSTVQDEGEDTVWMFHWRPGAHVEATKVKEPTEFRFLPSWYTERF